MKTANRSLTFCPTCNQQVSTMAYACPSCGWLTAIGKNWHEAVANACKLWTLFVYVAFTIAVLMVLFRVGAAIVRVVLAAQ